MALPNVNGVGTIPDPATGSEAIAVYVTRKVPRSRMREQDLIPSEVEGVPIRVIEIGPVSAQGEPSARSDS
jgi:hypothetical protein